MPIYEYVCPECNFKFEKLRTFQARSASNLGNNFIVSQGRDGSKWPIAKRRCCGAMAALTNCGHAQCAGMLLLDFRKWDKASTVGKAPVTLFDDSEVRISPNATC